MARLYVFAEGQTELTFARDVLGPHMLAHGVILENAMLVAHAFKEGKTHRGGGRKYGPARKDIGIRMKQRQGCDVFFTTMIDLYALYNDFPRRQESEKLRHLPYQRVEFLERAWSEDVGSSRFIPYIQLHEFEAYLFADPESFGLLEDMSPRSLRALREVADMHASPELINDSPETAPSKLLEKLAPSYSKRPYGPLLAGSIGIPRIRARCPHFHEWLTTLEMLGSTHPSG